MTSNAKIGFLWISWQVYIIYKVEPRNYRYAIKIENLIFVY